MPYMVTFTINIPPMLAYIPYMDPMGYILLAINSRSNFGKKKRTFYHDKSPTPRSTSCFDIGISIKRIPNKHQ